MIIGLTGAYCSGKDTVAEYLCDRRGFVHYSLSDELRRELAARGTAPSRENLIRVGTELRERFGNAALAERALARCATGGRYVITSIRHPAEVRALSGRPDFVLVTLDAPAGVRFERMRNRARPGDPATYGEFLACEARESQTAGSGQQLQACIGLASETILNDTDSFEDLHARVEEFFRRAACAGD